jgi:hypothetical protein
MVWGWNPHRKKDFSFLKNVQTGSEAQLTSYSMGTGILGGGGKGSQSMKLASHFHIKENIVA